MVRAGSVRAPLLLRQAVGGAVPQLALGRQGFLRVAALLAGKQVGHFPRPRVDQVFIVEIALAARKVGNRPAHDDGDEAAYEGVVHVGDGVELCQQIPARKIIINKYRIDQKLTVCNYSYSYINIR